MAEMDAFILARQARAAGDLELALANCIHAIELAPDHLAARLFKAQLLSDLKRWDHALVDFETCIVQNGEKTTGPWIGAVHCLRSLNRNLDALKKANEGIKFHPSSVTLKLVAAEIQREIGQWEAAERNFSSIIDSESDVPAGAFMGLGACVSRRDGVSAALPFYEKAHSVAPNARGPKLAMADVMRDVGRYQEAERLYCDLIHENPDDFQSRLGLAIIYRRRNGLVAACQYYQQALSIDPSNLIARLGFADCLLAWERVSEAARLYEKIVADHPENRQAIVGLASCIRRQNGVYASLECYRRAASIAPEDKNVTLTFANALKDAREFDEAQCVFEALVSNENTMLPALAGLAAVLREAKGADAALLILRRAVDCAPNDKSIRLQYANALRDCGQWADAEKSFRDLLKECPEIIQVHLGLYSCVRHSEGLEAALLQIERSRILHPKSEGINLAIADALRELARFSEANKLYVQLAIDNSKLIQAYIGLGLIARRQFDSATSNPYFEFAYNLAPDSRAARWHVCESLLELGRYENAKNRVDAWINESPRTAYLHFLRGKIIRASRGLVGEAIESFGRSADLAASDLGILKDCADIFREVGLLDRARGIYENLIEKNPKDQLLKLGLILTIFGCEQVDRARELLMKLAGDGLLGTRIAIEVIRVAIKIGSFDLARELLNKLLESCSLESVDCLIGCAQSMMSLADYDGASRLFEKAVSLSSGRLVWRVDLALSKAMQGHHGEASRIINAILSEQNVPIDIMIKIAQYYLKMGLNIEAQICAFEAFELPGSSMTSALTLIAALESVGETDEALKILDLAVQRFGLHVDLAISASRLMRGLGNMARSKEVMHSIQPFASSSLAVLLELFRAELGSGELEGAEFCIKNMYSLTLADRAEIKFCQGLLWLARWRHGEAIRCFRDAILSNQFQAEAHRHLAYCLLMSADVESAKKHVSAFTKIEAPIRLGRGIPLNISQSHIGQLVDEYSIDRNMCCILNKLSSFDPPRRISELIKIRDLMDKSTPAAMSLLIALRQAKMFVVGNNDSMISETIPKRIAQYWHESNIDIDLEDVMLSWLELNPNYEYIRFDETTAREFLVQNSVAIVVDAYDQAREPAMKADLFRLAWLESSGGFYADADDRCIQPLDHFIPSGASLILYQEPFGAISNTFMGSIPHHPVISVALSCAATSVIRGDQDLTWLSTGPGVLSRCLSAILVESESSMTANLNKISVFSYAEFSRYVAVNCSLGYKKMARGQGKYAQFGTRNRQNGAGPRRRQMFPAGEVSDIT